VVLFVSAQIVIVKKTPVVPQVTVNVLIVIVKEREENVLRVVIVVVVRVERK